MRGVKQGGQAKGRAAPRIIRKPAAGRRWRTRKKKKIAGVSKIETYLIMNAAPSSSPTRKARSEVTLTQTARAVQQAMKSSVLEASPSLLSEQRISAAPATSPAASSLVRARVIRHTAKASTLTHSTMARRMAATRSPNRLWATAKMA